MTLMPGNSMSLDIFGVGWILGLVAILLSFYWMFLITQTEQKKPVSRQDEMVSVVLDDFCLVRDVDSFRINDNLAQRVLLKFAGKKLILLATANDDEEADRITKAFTASCFAETVPRHRLILTEKEEGRISIIRQLQPSVHYDTSQPVISGLTGKVRQAVYMTDSFTSYTQIAF